MENTKGNPQIEQENEIAELQLLAIDEIQQDGITFQELACSIDALFYSYIQECVHRNSEICISQAQIYDIREVVNFLRTLHTITENKN